MSAITSETTSNGTSHSALLDRFGLTPEEAYQAALDVYRREKDSTRFSYAEKIKVSAYLRQCKHGKFTAEKFGDIGYFDFVGNDRRRAWQDLGDMSQEAAKLLFFTALFTACSREMEDVCTKVQQAKARAKEAAVLKAREEAERKVREEAERKALEEQQRQEAERLRREEQAQRDREAAAQAALLAQHSQDAALQGRDRQQQALVAAQHQHVQAAQQHQQQADLQQHQQDQRHAIDQVDGQVAIATPEVWSRPDRAEFIAQMKQDPEAVIILGHGETVTVKAITNPAGTRMFWEFATESYDIAFSVSFQWPAVDGVDGKVVEVLASARQPANQVVIGGSHVYPGAGTYLIQFDNTYSVLRAKTLYYRVYYAA